jgi:hypothetical protein
MFKLVGAIALLIVVALVALAYLQLSPILTFVIISVGLYLFARKGDGSLWPDSIADWTSGHGIYLGRKDQYVAGSDPDDTADKQGPDPERR